MWLLNTNISADIVIVDLGYLQLNYSQYTALTYLYLV